MNGHETALAELDRIGRHAAAALRSAVRNPDGAGTDRHIISAASASPVADAHDPEPIVPIHELELDLTAPDAGPGSAGPRRTRQRRLVLMAAAIAAVAGIGAVVTLRPPEPPEITAGGSGAPTAALGDGDGDGGIYPRDADHLGMTVASFDPSGDWQWTIDIPAAGHHLLFDLTDGSTTASYVMADLGSAPLQVATTDVDGQIGAGVVAVYGVVDARAVDLSSADDLVVEWSGADPVRLDVLAVDGATHNAFVGFVPRDVAADAQVIARTPTGEEIARVPLTWTGHTEEIASDDAIFPEGADPATPVRSEKESPDGTYWAAAVLSGGHHVALMVGGNEDSITTVFDAPGSEPLQVLATLLDGVTAEGGRDVAIYGIVEAAAETVELVVPGSEPVALDLEPIDGATHDTFVGFVPPGVGDDAVVVARDARGDELARRPLAWTIHDAADTRR